MADGIYEVIRSYDGHLFQLQQHIERLNYGAKALRFRQTSLEEFIDVAESLIEMNHLKQCPATVYLQITRGVAPRSHKLPSSETPLTMYAIPKQLIIDNSEQEKGISAITVTDQRWERCDIKSISLLLNSLAHQQAIDANAKESIFIRNGFLTEGSHTNVLMVKDNTIITPPITNHILDGITRKVVLQICKNCGIDICLSPIPENELFSADELMIVGTTVEITPVVQLNNQTIGNGFPGRFTRQLQKSFGDLTIKD